MSDVTRAALIALLLLFAVLLLGGCRSSGIGSVEQHASPAVGGQQPVFGEFLPSPRALLAGQEQARSASFSEEEYIRHGAEFIGLLPNRNALLAPGEEVQFVPEWSETEGLDPSRLAFCIYEYQIDGFDRNAELRCGWRVEPPDHRAVWFGLSDWDADGWHWLRGESDGVIGFGSAAPYFDETSMLYVVVVVADDESSILRHLRVGEMPATGMVLTATPRYARPPVTVTADASGCSVPVGTVESYKWDWDDDGSFEETTGTDPLCPHSFDTEGDFEYSVLLTSSYGETTTASDTVHIVEPWTHSWGDSYYQDITGIVTDGSEFCYSAGSITRSAGHRDALLLKHNLGGELEWAMAWGGEDGETLTDVELSFGDVFTVGTTTSYGAGDEDVLILRWNDDGSIYWSAVWGTAGLDRGEGIALTDTAVYVIGSTMAMGDRDVLLLKYDLSGNFVWARTWGNSGYDVGTDIASSKQLLLDEFYLYATGATFSPSPLYQDVLYLRIGEDASFPTERVWRSDSESNQFGSAITVTGMMLKDIHIAGYAGDIGERMSLLLYDGFTEGACLDSDYVATEETVADSILRLGEKLYIAGRSWDLGVSSSGFVAKYSLNLVPDSLACWSDGDDDTGITSLCSFPGSGLLAGGNCQSAAAGSWAGSTLDVVVLDGTWSDYSATVNVPMESTESPTAESEILTGGAIDTGGGSWDALLSIVQFP